MEGLSLADRIAIGNAIIELNAMEGNAEQPVRLPPPRSDEEIMRKHKALYPQDENKHEPRVLSDEAQARINTLAAMKFNR